jgi:hypothetical protein
MRWSWRVFILNGLRSSAHRMRTWAGDGKIYVTGCGMTVSKKVTALCRVDDAKCHKCCMELLEHR